MRRFLLLLYFVVLTAISPFSAVADDSEVIKQQLLAQPPQILADAVKDNPDGAIQVDFFKADLDGSGQFRFILAAYSQESRGWGVYLRVFKQEDATLRFIGESREMAVKSLGISDRIGSARSLQVAISKTAQALADGRLDVKAAAMMLEKIRAAAAGLQNGALTTDLHR